MELTKKLSLIEQEFDQYYTNYDPCTEKLLQKQ